MKNPLVSVLIPAFNHEDYVQESIKSVINQSYENIELIVIDDGSSDFTWKKILELKAECEKRFISVCFKTQDNIGASKTIEQLLSTAKGKYIYIIASDDMAESFAIEKQVKFLETNPDYGCVVGDSAFVDFKGDYCYWKNNNKDITYIEDNAEYKTFVSFLKKWFNYFNDTDFGTYRTLYKSNYIPNGYLIRKSLIDKYVKFPKEQVLEDWFLMLQLSKYTKFKYINKVLYLYRWHQDNTVTKNFVISLIAKNLRDYEYKIDQEICENKDLQKELLPGVLKYIKANITYYRFGELYKRFGIPLIFEFLKYKKNGIKTKLIKIINVTLFKWEVK